MILEKRIRYKLLRLLKVTTIITINSDKKTSNNIAFNKMLVKLFTLLNVQEQKKLEK
jgi:hypothetical protein